MAYKNHWLQRAVKDFDAIYVYYQQVAGEGVAKRRMSKILQATDAIAYMPQIGFIDEEYPIHRSIAIWWYWITEFIISLRSRWCILLQYGTVDKGARRLMLPFLNEIIVINGRSETFSQLTPVP